ncbi:putative sulfate exporter family transporter [Telmatospirillum sp.]|uniref:YeiH family protein n=1 Tax=Telmatospirillum sp. TaxID=2079197 RepID=UPI0028476F75|nr:putative sulfate exporter family transporter [Telmatospirillum sp.]MDR3437407.1 putative sulfate exporter family transporter [Telmatospirillum sp.]
MNEAVAVPPSPRVVVSSVGWRELWLKEDWWAIWLGLGLVIAATAAYLGGSSLAWIAVTPAKWSTFDQLARHFGDNIGRYGAQFVLWLVLFTGATSVLGWKAKSFVPAFILLYVLSLAIFALGAWDQAQKYNLEPPLVALLVGLAISNLVGLPRWLDAGFRVEFYIKTGIVLLGATLPFTLIVWAGPLAILQASIVSIVTFLVIYTVARKLGLDPRLSATLGAGGAVCGVSAAIAVGGAVGAKKEDPPIVITTVIIWAIVMIFVLPLVSRALHLHTAVAGAWIGTSEFADAAGFAAAQAYGGLAGKVDGIEGTPDQAVWAFTLMKVVGRDVWIGIWAFVLAIVATTRWERTETGGKPNAAEIWWRFPKFVIGFLVASVIITVIASGVSFADYDKVVKPALVVPITGLRTWAFVFCFLSIGLTTRFRELAPAGGKPFLAFTAGVVVNVVLGFVLTTVVFASYWEGLTR